MPTPFHSVGVGSRLSSGFAFSLGLSVLFGACGEDLVPNRGAPAGPATTMQQPTLCADEVVAAPAARLLSQRDFDRVVAALTGHDFNFARTFTADLRPDGFDNDAEGLVMSSTRFEELAAAADRVADYITAPERLASFAPCPQEQAPDACIRAFAASFGARAFGRALAADEVDELGALGEEGRNAGGYDAGIAWVATAVLQSPRALYQVELGVGARSGAELASALSLALTGQRPDAALTGDEALLASAEVRRAHALRLAATPQGVAQRRRFARQWLRVDNVERLNKDVGRYPEFTPDVRTAMGAELDRFIDDRLGVGLTSFLLDPVAYPTSPLDRIYGDDLENMRRDGAAVDTRPERRRGVLALPGYLATHASIDLTNPIARGLVVRDRLFCEDVPGPPASFGVVPITNEDPGNTTREKYAAHSHDTRCRGCHQLLDPIGFGFEGFDALGRWRSEEAGEPVDTSGSLSGTDVDGTFTGVAELAMRLARSEAVARCFVERFVQFAEGVRPSGPAGECRVRRLADLVRQKGGSWEALVAAWAGDASFTAPRSAP